MGARWRWRRSEDWGILDLAMSLARGFLWINRRHGWRTPCWAFLVALLAVCLDFIPLFDLLGYDFSFALGLVMAFAAADIGHGTVSAARREGREILSLRLVGQAIAASLAILIPPLLISLANAGRVRNCSLASGLAFFALLPVCTTIVSAGASATVAIFIPSNIPSRKWGRLAVLALPIASIAWSLVRLYRDPAVFAYDAFAGFFPGPIYDEALRPTLRLGLYRLANLTWLATLLAALHWLRHDLHRPRQALRDLFRPWQRPLAVGILLAASLAWFENRGRLGFHVTRADLARLLAGETRTQHFVRRTDPAADSDMDFERVQGDLEFRYQQLARILGVEPTTPITVYRFPSSAAKKDAVGAANTLYAKPWTREIFVQADRFPATRLRHELAHVFAGAFGDPAFGVSLHWRFVGPIPIPRLAGGLVEGLAEAADFDNPDGRSTTHEEAAAMLALGQAPDLRSALGAGFTLESGPRAYTLVGSFCRFLLERYGAEKLRGLYRSAGDFATVYGRDLPALEADWRAFLAALPLPESSRAQAEESFRRPAIFKKICARELAARVAEARARVATAPADAVAILSSTCGDDPNEPTFRLELADALVTNGEPDHALEVLAEAAATDTLTRPLRARANNLEAGIRYRKGELDLAQAALTRALTMASDDGEERTLKAKLRALRDRDRDRDRDKDSRATLGRVLFGDERGRVLDPGLIVYLVGEFARRFPDEALGPYLFGRQLALRDPKLAVPYLANACSPADGKPMAIPLDSVFFKECRRLLGESSFLAGDLSSARESFDWLAEHADSEADRLRALDFLQRIAWQAARQ